MADKPKKKAAKPRGDESGVMGSLSAQRPARIATGRTAAAKPPAPETTATTQAAAADAKPEPTAAKPKPAATAKAAPKPRATAARRKAAAPRTFEPTPAAEAAAGAADERAAGVTAAPPASSESTYPRPRAVREGAPGIGTTTLRDKPTSSDESGRPTGTELVAGAVKAAGQVAQLGLAIGGNLVKKAVERLPKP
jgi:hypothetical protein